MPTMAAATRPATMHVRADAPASAAPTTTATIAPTTKGKSHVLVALTMPTSAPAIAATPNAAAVRCSTRWRYSATAITPIVMTRQMSIM